MDKLAYEQTRNVNLDVGTGGFRGGEPYPFTVTNYSVGSINLGGNTYVIFDAVSVNLLEAVLKDSTYRDYIIIITALYLFLSVALSYGVLKICYKER